jgi:sugar lactone lactonase YvrE
VDQGGTATTRPGRAATNHSRLRRTTRALAVTALLAASAVTLLVDHAGASAAARATPADAAASTTPEAPTTLIASGLYAPQGVAVDAAGTTYVADSYNHRVLKLPKGGEPVTLGFVSIPNGVAVDDAGNVYATDYDHVTKFLPGGAAVTLGFTGLQHAQGIAVDAAGSVYVTASDNTATGRVLKLTAGGTQTTLGFTGLNMPQSLAVDGAGTVYVTDFTSDQVRSLSSGGSQATVPLTGVLRPWSVAVDDDGNLFVLDKGNPDSSVVEVAPGGEQATLGFTGLSSAQGVAVDPIGNVYVGDTGNNRVVELPTDGSQITLGFTGVADAEGVATDEAGNLYVSDAANHKIVELPKGGVPVDLPFTGLQYPFGVAVDHDGNVYATDRDADVVLKLTPSGDQVTLGFSGLDNPLGIVVDGAGTVSVVDGAHARVVRLTAGGVQTTLGFTGVFGAVGLAADGAGNLYLTETDHSGVGSVVELAPDGTQTTLGFTGLRYPAGVAVDEAGNVYVADNWRTRLFVLPKSGPQYTLSVVFEHDPDFSSTGVALDGLGHAYVSDRNAGLVEWSVVPDAPTVTRALPGNGTVSLTWSSPPHDGGSPVTGYTITPYRNGVAQPPVVSSSTATSRTMSGLTNGTAYTFRVAARTAMGPGDESGDSSAVTPGTPSMPGYQSASPGNGWAKVGWAAPSNNGAAITGYVITPVNGGTPEAPQTFATAATSDVVTGLANAGSYTFEIAALNARGTGAEAVTVPITVGAPTGPAFPRAVPGTTSARVAWSASTANAAPIQGYVVTPYIGATAQTPTTFHSTATTQTVTGLTSGVTYSFKVAAFNSVGTGPASQTATMVEGSPAQPPFQSAAPGQTTATVQYMLPAANSAPITSYTVWPVQGSTVLAPQVFATPAATKLTVTGLTTGVTYSFRVAATNSVGTGPYAVTNTVLVGSPGGPVFPSAQPGNATAHVGWTIPAGNGSPITGYVITPYIGTVAQPSRSFATTTNNATVTGLTNGTTYTFKVAAVNAIGRSLESTTAAIKVGTPTGAAFPRAAPLDGSAKVAWQASQSPASPLLGYIVTPIQGTTALASQTFNSTATTQVITGLTNGVTYTFRITPFNAIGQGPPSTTAAVKVGLGT